MGTIIGAVACSVNILRRRDADGPTSILAALKPVWFQGIYLSEPLSSIMITSRLSKIPAGDISDCFHSSKIIWEEIRKQ